MPSMNMSPVLCRAKPRSRMSSSPPSAAVKLMPAVFFSASLTVSRLRSSIRRSVTTVTDCGISRNCCPPLPMRVSLARRLSLPSGASLRSLTTTGARVLSGVAVCAMAPTQAPSIRAPRGMRGSNALSAALPRASAAGGAEVKEGARECSMGLRVRDFAKGTSVIGDVQVTRKCAKSRRGQWLDPDGHGGCASSCGTMVHQIQIISLFFCFFFLQMRHTLLCVAVKKAGNAGFFRGQRMPCVLLHMLADQAGEFKHRHLGLAEQFLELGIGVDVLLVGSVLQVVGPDVDPQLADDLRAWQRRRANHGGQRGAGCESLHESGVGAAFLGCGGCRCRRFFCSCHVGFLVGRRLSPAETTLSHWMMDANGKKS